MQSNPKKEHSLYAHYLAGKLPIVIISPTIRCYPEGDVHHVSGKKEAKAIAVKLGAKPWNF